MSKNIQDKVVVITGASSGLGEATARHLAALGALVVLGARRQDRLDAIVAVIATAGGKAIAHPTDVTRKEDLSALVAKAVEVFGRIDVMINNAGLMAISPISQLRTDEWDRMIDINIKGVLYGIAAALPFFEQQARCESSCNRRCSIEEARAPMVLPMMGIAHKAARGYQPVKLRK